MRAGSTVLCRVFRAPREYDGWEYSECSRMQRQTAEYVSLERWLGGRNPSSASRSSTGFTRMKGGIQVEEGSKAPCPDPFGSPSRVPSTNAADPCSAMQLSSPAAKPAGLNPRG